MPSRSSVAAAALTATAAAVATPTGVFASTYVVRPGDTLESIATQHGTTISALARHNGIGDPRVLRAGQLLRIPDARAALPAYTRGVADVEEYHVQPGDGLVRIARTFGIDPTALARANAISVSAPLSVGAVIHVPGRLTRVDALITEVSRSVGVDPRLVRAVAWMESGWQQHVVSPTGAVGVMQIEPYTGEWVSRYLAQRHLDIHIAHDNVVAGTLLLERLLEIHKGDVAAALAAYYQGDASIRQHGLFQDTVQYQRVVAALMNRE